MGIKILDVKMTIPNKLIAKVDNLLSKNNYLKKALENLIKNAKIIENMIKTIEIQKLKAKEKIQNSVNLLRLAGEKINAYKIVKLANIFYIYCKKIY